MTRYHRTGQDNWTPKPQSGHSREWVHGPLQPLEEDARMPPLKFVGAVALLAFLFVLVAIAAAALP